MTRFICKFLFVVGGVGLGWGFTVVRLDLPLWLALIGGFLLGYSAASFFDWVWS